jgi:hypothetical protein
MLQSLCSEATRGQPRPSAPKPLSYTYSPSYSHTNTRSLPRLITADNTSTNYRSHLLVPHRYLPTPQRRALSLPSPLLHRPSCASSTHPSMPPPPSSSPCVGPGRAASSQNVNWATGPGNFVSKALAIFPPRNPTRRSSLMSLRSSDHMTHTPSSSSPRFLLVDEVDPRTSGSSPLQGQASPPPLRIRLARPTRPRSRATQRIVLDCLQLRQ